MWLRSFHLENQPSFMDALVLALQEDNVQNSFRAMVSVAPCLTLTIKRSASEVHNLFPQPRSFLLILLQSGLLVSLANAYLRIISWISHFKSHSDFFGIFAFTLPFLPLCLILSFLGSAGISLPGLETRVGNETEEA